MVLQAAPSGARGLQEKEAVSGSKSSQEASQKVSGMGDDPLTHTLIVGVENGPAILSFYTSLSEDPAIPTPVLTQEK